MEKKHVTQKRYPAELKERGVRLAQELRKADPGDHGVISRVARQLGVGVESLRLWVKQAEVDAGRWGLDGAEAVLKLRALRANGCWDDYWSFHLAQERKRVHESRYLDGALPIAA